MLTVNWLKYRWQRFLFVTALWLILSLGSPVFYVVAFFYDAERFYFLVTNQPFFLGYVFFYLCLLFIALYYIMYQQKKALFALMIGLLGIQFANLLMTCPGLLCPNPDWGV